MIRLSFLVAILVTICYSYSFSQLLFAPPQNLGPKINTSSTEFDPFWDGPRKRLYFVSTRNGSEDIWYSDWTDTGWTQARPLGPQINSGRIEHSPSVSPDGQKLYYIDAERGGYNWDIWVSTWDSSLNDWGIPVNLGPPVNTPGTEFSAHISPDGRHFYFSSLIYIPDSLNRCGTFVSEWNGTGWGEPVKFALNLGFCDGWQYPSITADSLWFYFDNFVSDGQSSFVSHWNGSSWDSAVDLRPQIGGRSSTPYTIPAGDSLFFGGATIDLGGFGMSDIFLMPRVVLGDLNLDGRFSPADVVLELFKVFLGWVYPAPEPYGDMNCDNQFTGADAALLLLVVYVGAVPEC